MIVWCLFHCIATVLEHNEGFQASSFLPKLGPITRATKRTLALRDSESLRSAKRRLKGHIGDMNQLMMQVQQDLIMMLECISKVCIYLL